MNELTNTEIRTGSIIPKYTIVTFKSMGRHWIAITMREFDAIELSALYKENVKIGENDQDFNYSFYAELQRHGYFFSPAYVGLELFTDRPRLEVTFDNSTFGYALVNKDMSYVSTQEELEDCAVSYMGYMTSRAAETTTAKGEYLLNLSDIAQYAGGGMLHTEVAEHIRTLKRDQADHEEICLMANERLLALAKQDWLLREALADLENTINQLKDENERLKSR